MSQHRLDPVLPGALMRLSEIRQTLNESGIQLTKSLGQNFLHDAHQLARIVAAAELKPTDQVLEIGPGLGPLTQLLVEKSARVLAIEKDRRLIELLRHRLGDRSLTIIYGDAMQFLREEPAHWSAWKVVSNLPYSVGSAILVQLAQFSEPPERVVATLQWEVAQRSLASVATPDYGIFTLLVQATYQPGGSFKIPASCFFPEPRVDSGCVTLIRRKTALLTPEERLTFDRIVKRGFSQRRKMMFKLLKTEWAAPDLEAAFGKAGLSSTVRAEHVSLEQFVQLTHHLNQTR